MSRLIPILVTASLSLVGCNVGPDYEAPNPLAPEDWALRSAVADQPETAPAPDSSWWDEAFADPLLSELVQRALDNNKDLAVARARLREARALARASDARLLPRASFGGGAARVRQSQNALFPIPDPELDFYQVGFDASWELDVFGGLRRGVEAAEARSEASQFSTGATWLSVIAEVVRNYLELRSAQLQFAALEQNIRDQERTLELVGRRIDAGLASAFDRRRTETLLATTRAALPSLRLAARSRCHRIAVLTGEPPAAWIDRLLPAGQLPEPPQGVPLDSPAALLARRPDVAAAERALHAATAEIGVATAELYPKFELQAQFGLESTRLEDLLQSASRTFQVGPGFSWRLFEGGAIRAGIDAAHARADAAAARWEQAVLHALEDVENALARLQQARDEAAAVDAAQAAAAESVRLAENQYRRGLADLLDVLDARRQRRELDRRAAAARANTSLAVLAVYKALGGGWSLERETAAARLPGGGT